ncbi:hypothetical protein VRRI112168_02640 [Vreelandella rituensis]|uniref:DUF3108 domain-containing protein n=1 Tax=Vreelandella rituensis TaxID=2282306 RepID=A0A368UBE6_9GAMM|nr:hypothetical protein [Halomonas rituensis]RCV93642.1 hypothetical protein DU506_00360 [Halomonas rituensis]
MYLKFLVSTASLAALLATSPAAANSGQAADSPANGFKAHYRLDAPGMPVTTIEHQLAFNEYRVESSMEGKAGGIASATERSRFLDMSDTLTPLLYVSAQSTFGFKKEHRMSQADLSGLLDRQMMLYQLSRDARNQSCPEASPCSLAYADHQGKIKQITYHQYEFPAQLIHGESLVPAGIIAREANNRDPMRLAFHPTVPGLILEAEVPQDDDRPYRLTFRDVAFR